MNINSPKKDLLTNVYRSQSNFNIDLSVLVIGFVRLIQDIHWILSAQSKLVVCADFVICLFEIQSCFAQ